MSYPTVQGRAVEGVPYREAQVCLGTAFPNSYYQFSVSGGNTASNVYQNGTLTTAFPITGHVVSDNYGRFPPIYLDPSVTYRVRFFNNLGVQQWQQDPYYSQLSTVGTSSLSAYGMSIAATGEVTVPAPNSGGSGVSLTLKAGSLGSAALQVSSTIPGNSAIIVNSSATTGTQTATFTATNKPGPNITNTLLATAAPSGATYTGGTLTASYPGATTSSAVIVLSTGQTINGATFTAGSATFTTPSTNITGTPTTLLQVTGPQASAPAGWLPITCDGVQYYTPIWFDNNFQRYTSTPGALGEQIFASSVTFGGNGVTTATGGEASVSPSNWFSPAQTGVGAGYYINITKTYGPSGLAFVESSNTVATVAPSGATYTGGTLTAGYAGNTASNYIIILSTGQQITGCTFTNGSTTFSCPSTSISGAPNVVMTVTIEGVWTNIGSGGLTITSNAAAVMEGTYQLSSSVTGSPVVATGFMYIYNNNGVQQPTYNGATPLVLAGNGTATLNGASSSNWFTPTTTNVGSGYYISVTQTGGSGSFTGLSGVTNISSGGLTIGVSGAGTFSATGTYTISSDSAGAVVLGSGSITLTGTDVASSNWSGTTPLNLAGNGAATLNGSATSSWYSPNAANVGSGYWINITRTGGTAGVNFTAAQGSWTNITNSGLTIGLGGYTGDVGTVTASGTYQISSSSSGTPVLGSGTIALSLSGLTATRVYTTVGSGTETIPSGATTVQVEVWGAGGGAGGSSNNTGQIGSGGGTGALSYSSYAVSALGGVGSTFNYTVPAGGVGGASTFSGLPGSAGSTGSISAGTVTGFTTMTATGGGGGQPHLSGGGAGGTATGGNVSNTTGTAGSTAGAATAGLSGSISGDGGPYGAGGAGQLGQGLTGGNGAVVFRYS